MPSHDIVALFLPKSEFLSGNPVNVTVAVKAPPPTLAFPFGFAAAQFFTDEPTSPTEKKQSLNPVAADDGVTLALRFSINTPGDADEKVNSFCPSPETLGEATGSP